MCAAWCSFCLNAANKKNWEEFRTIFFSANNKKARDALIEHASGHWRGIGEVSAAHPINSQVVGHDSQVAKHMEDLINAAKNEKASFIIRGTQVGLTAKLQNVNMSGVKVKIKKFGIKAVTEYSDKNSNNLYLVLWVNFNPTNTNLIANGPEGASGSFYVSEKSPW
jgi:hypothetical protein